MEDKIRSVVDRLIMVGNWVIRLEKGMFLGIIGSVITPLCLVELCLPLAGYIFNTNLIAGIFLALLNLLARMNNPWLITVSKTNGPEFFRSTHGMSCINPGLDHYPKS